ncbi:hypothetical protein HF086_009634 [Spodoptera exigua]|uniref:Protein-lysine N-methyltransferase n=1 Tax=Spodoptera exigua TaxID=7107 RepID=A0A922MTY5_SPOEX|nr:hypothetical protein HF086_009634 [Spodoptera exigua]
MDADDDDVPALSAETFAALQEFYAEQQKRQEILDKLEADNKLKENILFDENWVRLLTLLEYDRRFEVHAPDFVFYDYNCPDKLPPELLGSYDLVVADPPFLSEECITKTSQTIKLMAKDKIIVCTGAIMKDKAKELLGLDVCEFQPHHRNNLANEFSCYANFDVDGILR